MVGCWNYAYRPGEPWNGIVCYPRLGGTDSLQFGDLMRLRYETQPSELPLRNFDHIYQSVDFADFSRDGMVDLVVVAQGSNRAQFFLNTGKRDGGGLPIFAPSDSASVSGWEACRAVDLDRDGVLDLVVDGQYFRNQNPAGWPFRAGPPFKLNVGRGACFFDVDRDGSLDAVYLAGGVTPPDDSHVVWRRNRGGDPPVFADEELASGIELMGCTLVAPASDGGRAGLLLQHDVYQQVSFFEQRNGPNEKPRFAPGRRAESVSAVISLSDQAWPCLCDWDDDGDPDLLIGGGYGWPRIVINEGTRDRPIFGEPKLIFAGETPIRLLRNEILGEPHNWHNMGYPLPDFVDWDGDGLRDLMLLNETNRIFWYKNVGKPTEPKFAQRSQILCDGYPDSPQLREQSARQANDPHSNNGVYPLEPEQPFMWRTGAAFADWNGDGLMDFVTLDGHTRRATLFVQYKDQEKDGQLRVKKDRVLALEDGRPIDDRIIQRTAHWTESFRAIDWDGDTRSDLIYSVAGAKSGTQDGGSIYLLRNRGSRKEPIFERPHTLRCFGEPIRITDHGPHPWPGDFDGDGKPDLLCCVEWSVYPLYRYAALTMPSRPEVTLGKPRLIEQP